MQFEGKGKTEHLECSTESNTARPNKEKTKLCKYFSKGSCHKGEGCSFIHESRSQESEKATLPVTNLSENLADLDDYKKGGKGPKKKDKHNAKGPKKSDKHDAKGPKKNTDMQDPHVAQLTEEERIEALVQQRVEEKMKELDYRGCSKGHKKNDKHNTKGHKKNTDDKQHQEMDPDKDYDASPAKDDFKGGGKGPKKNTEDKQYQNVSPGLLDDYGANPARGDYKGGGKGHKKNDKHNAKGHKNTEDKQHQKMDPGLLDLDNYNTSPAKGEDGKGPKKKNDKHNAKGPKKNTDDKQQQKMDPGLMDLDDYSASPTKDDYKGGGKGPKKNTEDKQYQNVNPGLLDDYGANPAKGDYKGGGKGHKNNDKHNAKGPKKNTEDKQHQEMDPDKDYDASPKDDFKGGGKGPKKNTEDKQYQNVNPGLLDDYGANPAKGDYKGGGKGHKKNDKHNAKGSKKNTEDKQHQNVNPGLLDDYDASPAKGDYKGGGKGHKKNDKHNAKGHGHKKNTEDKQHQEMDLGLDDYKANPAKDDYKGSKKNDKHNAKGHKKNTEDKHQEIDLDDYEANPAKDDCKKDKKPKKNTKAMQQQKMDAECLNDSRARPNKEKTKPCKYFSEGCCHKGEGCSFMHEQAPDRLKVFSKKFRSTPPLTKREFDEVVRIGMHHSGWQSEVSKYGKVFTDAGERSLSISATTENCKHIRAILDREIKFVREYLSNCLMESSICEDHPALRLLIGKGYTCQQILTDPSETLGITFTVSRDLEESDAMYEKENLSVATRKKMLELNAHFVKLTKITDYDVEGFAYFGTPQAAQKVILEGEHDAVWAGGCLLDIKPISIGGAQVVRCVIDLYWQATRPETVAVFTSAAAAQRAAHNYKGKHCLRNSNTNDTELDVVLPSTLVHSSYVEKDLREAGVKGLKCVQQIFKSLPTEHNAKIAVQKLQKCLGCTDPEDKFDISSVGRCDWQHATLTPKNRDATARNVMEAIREARGVFYRDIPELKMHVTATSSFNASVAVYTSQVMMIADYLQNEIDKKAAEHSTRAVLNAHPRNSTVYITGQTEEAVGRTVKGVKEVVQGVAIWAKEGNVSTFSEADANGMRMRSAAVARKMGSVRHEFKVSCAVVGFDRLARIVIKGARQEEAAVAIRKTLEDKSHLVTFTRHIPYETCTQLKKRFSNLKLSEKGKQVELESTAEEIIVIKDALKSMMQSSKQKQEGEAVCFVCLCCSSEGDKFELNCGHIMCFECAGSFIQEEVPYRCMHVDHGKKEECGQMLLFDEVKNIANTFDVDTSTLIKKARRYFLKTHHTTHRDCFLTVDCPGILEIDLGKANGRFVPCSCCEKKLCPKCQDQEHRDERDSCEQFEKRHNEIKKENAEADKYMQTLKSCPRCKAKTLMDGGGCNAVYCPCGCNWCWLCGKECISTHFERGSCKGKLYNSYGLWGTIAKTVTNFFSLFSLKKR